MNILIKYKLYNEELIKKYNFKEVDKNKIKKFRKEMAKNATLYYNGDK